MSRKIIHVKSDDGTTEYVWHWLGWNDIHPHLHRIPQKRRRRRTNRGDFERTLVKHLAQHRRHKRSRRRCEIHHPSPLPTTICPKSEREKGITHPVHHEYSPTGALSNAAPKSARNVDDPVVRYTSSV